MERRDRATLEWLLDSTEPAIPGMARRELLSLNALRALRAAGRA